MNAFYQNMSSHLYPSQRNYACYGQHLHLAQMSQLTHPVHIGPWLQPGGHFYPAPTGCHDCCGHNHLSHCGYGMPSCYATPPIFVTEPIPFQPYTDYHLFGTASPHYILPWTLQRHESPSGREHCHRRRNHTYNGEANGCLKIEEQVPLTAQMINDHQLGGNEIRFPRCHANINQRIHEREPKSWYGWHPIDLEHVGKADNKPLSTLSVFPGTRNSMYVKGVCPTLNSSMEHDPLCKVIPSRFFGGDKSGIYLFDAEGNLVNEVNMMSSSESMGNCTMASIEECLEKTRDSYVKMEKNSREKEVNNNKRKQSVSPVQTSKLPPVCLRVDPLTKSGSGNSSSRFLSPSSDERKNGQNHASNKLPKDKSLKESTSKVIKVEEKKPRAYNNEALKFSELKASKVDEMDASATETQLLDTQPISSAEHNLAERKFSVEHVEKASVNPTYVVAKFKDNIAKPLLTREDAALLIQSAYRGFEVRRWEPVKKLKQIAKVKEQLKHVKEKMHELEANGMLEVDEKQRAITSENIMRLLLQLDAIQSVHPSVREIRKSVAKELIFLQEKLDLIIETAGNKTVEAKSKVNEMIKSGSSLSPIQGQTLIQDKESVLGEKSPDSNAPLNPLLFGEENVGAVDSVNKQAGEGQVLEQELSSQQELPIATMEEQVEDHILSPQEPTKYDCSIRTFELEGTFNDKVRQLPALVSLERQEEGPAAAEEQAPDVKSSATDVKEVVEILEEVAPQSPQSNGITSDEAEKKSGPNYESDEHGPSLVEKFVVLENDGLEAEVEPNIADNKLSEIEMLATITSEKNPEILLQELTVDDEEYHVTDISPTTAACVNTQAEVKQVIDQVSDIAVLTESMVIEHERSPYQYSVASTHKEDETAKFIKKSEMTSPITSMEESVINNREHLSDENEELKKMVETVIAAGKEQLSVIGELIGKVTELERKLSKKKRLKLRYHKHNHTCRVMARNNVIVEESLSHISAM